MELTDSPNHGSRPTTTPPPGSRRALTRSRAGATGVGPESEPTEGRQEPPQRTRTPPPPTPETTEVNAELPVCSVCLGDASNPSVSLSECRHAVCTECYARAFVRGVGDILHCPMCRVGSAISGTSDRLQRQHGSDVVSEAMQLARSDRDLVSSTALEARSVQLRWKPVSRKDPATSANCHELIGQAASISPSCGCHFHPRCAVGIVEDNLPIAMAYGHDTTPFRARTTVGPQDMVLGHLRC